MNIEICKKCNNHYLEIFSNNDLFCKSEAFDEYCNCFINKLSNDEKIKLCWICGRDGRGFNGFVLKFKKDKI